MPDPRQKLYKSLSSKFDLGSYDEFNSKMNNPESRKKLYNSVSSNFDLGSYEEFESKIATEKKKDVTKPNSTSTSDSQKQVSEQTNGSSVSNVPDIIAKNNEKARSVPKGTKFKLAGEKGKPSANVNYDNYDLEQNSAAVEKKAPKSKNYTVASTAYNYALNNVDKSLSEQRYKDEVDNYQFFDGIKQGMKNTFNTFIGNPLTKLNESLGGNKDFTISQYKPLESELKQAKKELFDERGNNKFTEEEIQERAKKIFIDKDIQEQMHSIIDKALPFGYDREGIWKELKLEQLRSNDILREKVASSEVFKSKIEEFEEFSKNINRENPTEQDIEKFNTLKEEALTAVDGLNYLSKNYDKYVDLAKTDEEKLELFKYNYNDFEKNAKLFYTSSLNIIGGTLKLAGETNTYIDEQLGLVPIGGTLQSELGSEMMNDAKKTSDPFYRYKATKLNSFSDFGSFAAQLTSEQLPILATIYLGGTTGVATTSMSSGGQKINDLEEQAKQPFGRVYSDGEKLATGWLYAGAEFFPEKIGTARILKDLERTVSSASTASRKLFRDSFIKQTTDGVKKLAYYSGLEGGTELVTAQSQITIDEELLNIVNTDAENNEKRMESFFSGAIMGGGMSVVGGGLGFVTAQAKLYSEAKDVKEVKSILNNIQGIQNEIETNVLLTDKERTELYQEMNVLTNQAFETIAKNANKATEFSVEEKSALLDINLRQAELKSKYKEIADSNFSKEIKNKKVQELESEYNSLEEKRNSVLKGEFNTTKQDAVQQEATTTETKQEAQPQAEVQKTEQEDLETPIVENETAPSQVDNVDGNVQPGNNVVEPSGITEQENNQASNIQPADNSRNIEVKREIKIADKGQSYTVEKTDLGLVITDKKGKKPSKVTERKILDEYVKTINFTQGTRVDDSFESSAETYIDDVATKSQNPSEIAEAIAYVENADMNDGKVDPIQIAIANALGEKSVEKSSFTNINDRNNINQSIALQYFAQKGKGKGLDEIAMEVEYEVFGDYNANNPRITEEDIANFIVDNPRGAIDFLNKNRNEALEKLKTAFTDVTGLPAKPQFIQKAIDQQIELKNQLFAGNSLYALSEEDLLSLDNDYQQFKQFENNEQQQEAINETPEARVDIKNTAQRGKESRVQETRGIETSAKQREVTPEEKPSLLDEKIEKDEFDNTDLEDDTEIQSQGFFNGSKQNKRDLALSDNGPVKIRFPFQKTFKRVWANTFKSNSGLSKESGEVVRSRNRILATYTDHINQESKEFDKIIKSVKKEFPKEFNQKLIEINNYLSGDKNADISFLNQEQIDKLDYFRERIDSLSRSLITLLEDKMSSMKNKQAIESTKELIETIKQNMGIYITRNYQIFSDDNYRDMITGDFEKINKEGQLRIRNAINYLIREEGLTKDEATKSVAEYLAEIRRKKSDFFVQSSGNAVSNFFKKRKGIPKEFRELLGESKDPIYNYINTVYKISQYLGNIEYQYNLREHLINNQIASLEPKLGYEKIAGSSEGWRILNDIYVPVEFKEAFDDMQPLQTIESGFYKTWIKIAGIVKINKTILSPTTAARNLLSGVFLGANSGHFFLLKPSSAANAWNQAWATKKTKKELFNERQKLIKLGVLGDGANSGELMALLNDFSKEVDRMINKNAFELFFEKAKDLYAFGDDFYKVSGFYIERDRLIKSGLSESEAENKAAYRISNGYPTYSYLPKNIQRLRRLPLIGTFVSFPYETIRSTKNNIYFIKEDLEEGRTKMAYQRAAGMIVANATLGGLNMLTMSMLGLTDDDDNAIRDMLPEWQKNSKLIYLGTKNEKPIFIDGTALFPSEVIFKPVSILLEKREGRELEDKLKIAANEVLSPYISKDISFKTLTEIFENENEFNEKIYMSDNLLEGILNESEKILNYLMRQAGPGVYNNITEFLRANEIKPNFFGDKFSAYGKEYTNQEALLGLLGFRISTINYNAAMSSYAYQVKKSETEDKSSSNKLVKTSKKLTNDEIKAIVEDYAKYHNENYKQMVNIVYSGKKLGMSDDEIKKSLKLSKISDNDIRDLLKGKIPRLSPMSKQTKSNFKEKLKINYKGKNINDILNNFESNFRKMNIEIKQYNRTKIE